MAEVIQFPWKLLPPQQVQSFVQQVAMLVRENTFQDYQLQGENLELDFGEVKVIIEGDVGKVTYQDSSIQNLESYRSLLEATAHTILDARIQNHFYPPVLEVTYEEE